MNAQASRTGAEAEAEAEEFTATAERAQFRPQTTGGTPSNQANVDANKTVDRALERRQERIAIAAYYRAERRGFATGSAMEDWIEAERLEDLIGGEFGD